MVKDKGISSVADRPALDTSKCGRVKKFLKPCAPPKFKSKNVKEINREHDERIRMQMHISFHLSVDSTIK